MGLSLIFELPFRLHLPFAKPKPRCGCGEQPFAQALFAAGSQRVVYSFLHLPVSLYPHTVVSNILSYQIVPHFPFLLLSNPRREFSVCIPTFCIGPRVVSFLGFENLVLRDEDSG